MIFAKEPFLLHLLAGSETMTALDAVKNLLDSGAHDANEREPGDNLSPLHVAAAWDNLAMCQLLIHYGAEVDAVDIDKRRPLDVASGECKRFLKRLRKKRRRERSKFHRILAYLFRGICTHQDAVNQSILWTTTHENAEIGKRKSCPGGIPLDGFAHIQQDLDPPRVILENKPPSFPSRQIPTAPMPTPIAPKRSSSLAREFLTSDNSFTSCERQIGLDTKLDEDENNKEQRVKQREAEEKLRHHFAELHLDELKARLRRKNCAVGPIDRRNRRAYEAKLAKLELGKAIVTDPESIRRYSSALQKMVLNDENGLSEENQTIGQREEQQIKNEYLASSANKEVSFFCYLLIDPTLLPQVENGIEMNPSFRRFLATIFYVGKGKRSRPLQHLIQASKCRQHFLKSRPTERSEKLKRILELWDKCKGVISVHVFYNIHSAEALVREGAMIDAFGVENLTNLQRGSFPGVASQWTRQQISEFGARLLYKAYGHFQNERCRPIFEADIVALR